MNDEIGTPYSQSNRSLHSSDGAATAGNGKQAGQNPEQQKAADIQETAEAATSQEASTLDHCAHPLYPAGMHSTRSPVQTCGRQEPGCLGKVLVISPQPFYQDRGTPIAVDYVLRALTEIGYAVDLLTYPVGDSPEINGVRYVRVRNPAGFKNVPVSFSGRKLFLDMLLLVRLRQLLRSEHYVYVHAVEEAAFMAAACRSIQKSRVVYDMASSLPEQLANNRFFRLSPVMGTCRWLERWLLRHVDYVVASAGLKKKVLQIAPDARVREWCFPAESAEIPETVRRDLRKRMDISDHDRVVVYAGTFEFYQGIDDVIAAVPKVLDRIPEAMFVLVGAMNHAQVEEFRAKVDPRSLDRLRILPRIRKDEVRTFLSIADVLVSSRKVGRNIPLKIFDYLAAGRPIVATDIEAHRAIVDDSLAELVTADSDGISSGIVNVLGDSSRATALAKASADYASQKLSWTAFLQFMQSLAGEKTGAVGTGVS